MTDVVITLKIMPESPEVSMSELTEKVLEKVKIFTGETQTKTEIEPIAFGLSALKVTFVSDEAKGTTDDLEKEIAELDRVISVECIDVRRAVG